MEILKSIGPSGKLIALDQDASALERFRSLGRVPENLLLVHSNYVNADSVLNGLGVSTVNRIIIDIGLSSDQLADPVRGFSFASDGNLDMRMDPSGSITAADIVNTYSENELVALFQQHGEFRIARKAAYHIVRSRPLHHVQQLVKAIEKSLPPYISLEKGKRPAWARNHPATKIFQAIRVAVNRELEILEESLPKLFERLASRGRMAVISFHSSEDRIVKRAFLQWTQSKQAIKVIHKPVTADREECLSNPRARSAKLRVVEKL